MGDSADLRKGIEAKGKRRVVFMGRREEADGVHYLPCSGSGIIQDEHIPSSSCYCDPVGFFGTMVKVWAHRSMGA